jgi:hypothetical protein
MLLTEVLRFFECAKVVIKIVGREVQGVLRRS